MKKIFIFLFIPLLSKGQADSTKFDTIPGVTTYVQLEYQRTYKVKPHSKSEFLQDSPWIWVSTGKKSGLFIFGSRDSTSGEISLGPYFSFGEKVYHEIGIGPGIEIPDEVTELDPVSAYIWAYYYFENKPEKRLAKNKVILQLQYAYSKSWENWVMGSFTWTPFQKFFGIGLWGQTQTSWGAKGVFNIPLGTDAVISTWVGGGLSHRVTFGADFILQVTGKGSIRKK